MKTKTKLQLVSTFNCSKHFLPALINNDYSGLLETPIINEIKKLNDFLYPQFSNCFFVPDDSETQIGKCDVLGLISDISAARVYANIQAGSLSASALKNAYISANPDGHFFDRSSMRFFGDSMGNYGVKNYGMLNGHDVWELYRKRAVKHGLKTSHFFDKQTFEIILK